MLGGPLLEDVAEFLLDLRTTYDGLAARARTIEHHLHSATTVIVATADPTPLRETRRFFDELPEANIRPGGIIFNRALPLEWTAANNQPLGVVGDAGVRDVLKQNLVRWAGEARRQADAREELGARYRVPIATVPWVADAPNDADDLRKLLAGSEGVAGIVGAVT